MLNRRLWRDYFENILVAVLLALFVRTFIWTGYRVPTSSMSPTLLPGDFIFAYRLPFGIKLPLTQSKWIINTPGRGDVVVFTFPEQPKVSYVKRVIGLPGDRVEIKQGELWLNESKIDYQVKNQTENTELDSFSDFEVLQENLPSAQHAILRKKNTLAKSFGPLVVPPNEIFLLGDNRDASDDSRYWGTVPLERVEGRVQLIWMSLDWTKKWADNRLPEVRKKRLFTQVH